MAETQTRAQIAIGETIVESPEIEALLDAREAKRAEASTARHNFKVADDAVQPRLAELELEDGVPIRIGKYVITKSSSAAAHVEFERGGGSQIRIRVVEA